MELALVRDWSDQHRREQPVAKERDGSRFRSTVGCSIRGRKVMRSNAGTIAAGNECVDVGERMALACSSYSRTLTSCSRGARRGGAAGLPASRAPTRATASRRVTRSSRIIGGCYQRMAASEPLFTEERARGSLLSFGQRRAPLPSAWPALAETPACPARPL